MPPTNSLCITLSHCYSSLTCSHWPASLHQGVTVCHLVIDPRIELLYLVSKVLTVYVFDDMKTRVVLPGLSSGSVLLPGLRWVFISVTKWKRSPFLQKVSRALFKP